jgi:hypothetical protein
LVSTHTYQKHLGNTVANDGVPTSPQAPCCVYVPSAIEESIFEVVKWFRARMLPSFPDDVKEWATEELRGTPLAETVKIGNTREG